jgi:hypothetical protein
LKLKLEFAVDLPIQRSPDDIVSMTALMPLPNAQAIAFGWVKASGEPDAYWLADIRPEGVTHRFLPPDVMERLIALTNRPSDSSGNYTQVLAFRLGDGVGLLFGTHEVLYYRNIHAEPTRIEIANGFPGYHPLRCGHAVGNRVPVVLSWAGSDRGTGRHASLLEIDTVSESAHWLFLDESNAPLATRATDYGQHFADPPVGHLRRDGSLMYAPQILDCAWQTDQWLIYAGGFSAAYHRHGLAPSLLSAHRADLSMTHAVFEAPEHSFGRICASGNRMILTPLHKNGLRKGKQAICSISDGELVTPTLPRGHAGYHVVEYFDGLYWLLPNPWGYGSKSLTICSGQD